MNFSFEMIFNDFLGCKHNYYLNEKCSKHFILYRKTQYFFNILISKHLQKEIFYKYKKIILLHFLRLILNKQTSWSILSLINHTFDLNPFIVLVFFTFFCYNIIYCTTSKNINYPIMRNNRAILSFLIHIIYFQKLLILIIL